MASTVDYEVRNRIGTVIATAGSKYLAINAAEDIARKYGWSGLTVHRVRRRVETALVYAVGAAA